MRVYADVLVVINTAVSLILLLFAGKLSGAACRPKRLVLVSLILGVLCLWCVAYPRFALLCRVTCLPLAALLCWGRSGWVKNTVCLAAANLLLVGAVQAYQAVFDPVGFLFAAGTVYVDITFWQLMVLCGASYLIGSAVLFLHDRFSYSSFLLRHKEHLLHGVIDSGNALISPYGGVPCVLCDRRCPLLTSQQKEQLTEGVLPTGFVLIPVRTASGEDLLPGKNYAVDLLSQKGKLLQKDVHICVVFGKGDLPDGVQALLPLLFKRRSDV